MVAGVFPSRGNVGAYVIMIYLVFATPVCNECGDILYEYEIDEN